MEIYNKIRQLRIDLGITQAELSRRCGISLAFVQQIENGQANPSLETLNAILRVLGLSLIVQSEPPTLDELASIGIPIACNNQVKMKPARETVFITVAKLCLHLKGCPDERMQVTLASWLLAVKNEFPRFFKEELAKDLILSYMPDTITGQHIKLKRIATERIITYL